MVFTSTHLSLRPSLSSNHARSKPLQTLAESVGSIFVAGLHIKHQTSIKNLGVVSISTPDYLSTNRYLKHVKRHISTSVPCATFDHLSPCTEGAETVASAIAGSRLDYCNSLLAGTSVSNLAHLQLVQNTIARVVDKKSRCDHITPVLSEFCSV